jgi:hypothetical protein
VNKYEYDPSLGLKVLDIDGDEVSEMPECCRPRCRDKVTVRPHPDFDAWTPGLLCADHRSQLDVELEKFEGALAERYPARTTNASKVRPTHAVVRAIDQRPCEPLTEDDAAWQ